MNLNQYFQDKRIDNQYSIDIQHTSSRGKADPSSMMLDNHYIIIIVEQKIKHKCSTWLTVAPTYENGFYMTPDVFRDAVALRYGRIPPKMKSVRDGCGEDFSVSHALDCKKGGLVARFQRFKHKSFA